MRIDSQTKNGNNFILTSRTPRTPTCVVDLRCTFDLYILQYFHTRAASWAEAKLSYDYHTKCTRAQRASLSVASSHPNFGAGFLTATTLQHHHISCLVRHSGWLAELLRYWLTTWNFGLLALKCTSEVFWSVRDNALVSKGRTHRISNCPSQEMPWHDPRSDRRSKG